MYTTNTITKFQSKSKSSRPYHNFSNERQTDPNQSTDLLIIFKQYIPRKISVLTQKTE